MPKRPWYPRNTGHYARDTKHLTLEQHGAYNLLMDHYWDHGEGCLPSDERKLLQILSRVWGVTPQKTRKTWQVLTHFFVKKVDHFSHKRLDDEIQQADELIEKKRKAGQAGGQASAKARGQASGQHNNNNNNNNNKKIYIPEGFSLTDDLIEYAAKKRVTDLNALQNFTENFIDQNKAKGYKYVDHKSAWKTWLRTAIDDGRVRLDPERVSEDY